MLPSLALIGAFLLTVVPTFGLPGPLNVKREHSEVEEAAKLSLVSLLNGHTKFLSDVKTGSEPDMLKNLTDGGQHPDFAFLGCSDSRVSESVVFSAKPGTLFTTRNIANVYSKSDTSAQSFLAYGVNALGAKHIIVMGHYGCGGVSGAILEGSKKLDEMDLHGVTASVSDAAVRAWIEPIMDLYQSSTREEVVVLRENNLKASVVREPKYSDPGFRALVEENVKRSARSIYTDPVIQNHFVRLHAQDSVDAATGNQQKRSNDSKSSKILPVFIHSWVYDMRTGEIKDLSYSFGPSGYTVPTMKDFMITNANFSTSSNLGSP